MAYTVTRLHLQPSKTCDKIPAYAPEPVGTVIAIRASKRSVHRAFLGLFSASEPWDRSALPYIRSERKNKGENDGSEVPCQELGRNEE